MNDDKALLSDKNENVVIYASEIERDINLIAESWNIEDIRKCSQRQWKAILTEIGYRYFKNNNDLLKDKSFQASNKYSYLNCNSYDYDKLMYLCDYYIYISNKYNKLISIVGFSNMLCINETTIELWKDQEPSAKSFKIFQKLSNGRQDCLKDKLYDSNQAVGTISIGNTEYNWSLPGSTREVVHRTSLSLEDIKNNIGLLQNNDSKN